jgi:hypothetical protein
MQKESINLSKSVVPHMNRFGFKIRNKQKLSSSLERKNVETGLKEPKFEINADKISSKDAEIAVLCKQNQDLKD